MLSLGLRDNKQGKTKKLADVSYPKTEIQIFLEGSGWKRKMQPARGKEICQRLQVGGP